jgi:hypothetical protein
MVAIVAPSGYSASAPNFFSVGARLPAVSMGGSSADAGSRCQNGESAGHEHISNETLAMMIQVRFLPHGAIRRIFILRINSLVSTPRGAVRSTIVDRLRRPRGGHNQDLGATIGEAQIKAAHCPSSTAGSVAAVDQR